MAIKKIWVLIGGFLLGTPLRASADPAKAAAPQKIDESTPDDDKAALQAAASEADQWAAKHKSQPAAPAPAAEAASAAPADNPKQNPATLPGVAAPSVAAPAPAVTPSAAPATTPPLASGGAKPAVTHAVGLNEMKGKLLSISDDPKTFRLIVDGGFNVEFTYDAKSSVVNGGDPIKMEDLGYNDQLIVRYSGRDLYAVEVERVSKAPRPE